MKMNAKRGLLIGGLTAVLVAPALLGREADVADQIAQTTAAIKAEQLGEAVKVSDLLGMEVKNLQGEQLGKVDELALDLEAGRIVYVILSSDERKAEEKRFAVASRSMHCDHSGKVVRVDLSLKKMKAAPAIDPTSLEKYSNSNQVAEIYQYYSERPYFVGSVEGKRVTPPIAPLGNITKASKVMGITVRNQAEEKLGTVDNLIVNLEHRRIAHVIVSSGGFLGMGDELSAMPPTVFKYDPTQDLLRVDLTKEDLSRAPHFKNSEWPDFRDPHYAESVYRAYRIEPYFKSDADNAGRNKQDREDKGLTPFDQGHNPADVATTQSIRKELVAQDDLSINARNVKVITKDGRVTLRGQVNSEEEKRRVTAITTSVVPADRVDNQLIVKR